MWFTIIACLLQYLRFFVDTSLHRDLLPVITLPLNRPLVSILILYHEKGAYILRNAIRSAQNQTLKNIEIIVADDASNDNAIDMVKEMAQTDPRIRYFKNPTSVKTNLNRAKAVWFSRGQFLMNLDSDDELVPNTAEVAYTEAITNSADVVEYDAFWRENNGPVRPWIGTILKWQTMDNNLLLSQFPVGGVDYTIWRKMVRRATWLKGIAAMGESVNWPLTVAEDRLHCAGIFKETQKLRYIRFPGYIYNFNTKNNSWDRTANNRDQYFKSCEQAGRIIERPMKCVL